MVKNNFKAKSFTLEHQENHWVGHFTCMASPCEVLIETHDERHAYPLIALAYEEVMRIEHKFSRYRQDNIMFQINNSPDKTVTIDAETYQLLHFAQQCYELSEGLFDITSGLFRQVWDFKQQKVPTQQQIDTLLPLIGFDKISFNSKTISLPKGMEIDFGGIGKEYAVDKVAALLSSHTSCSYMINFGGDCHVSGPQKNDHAWITGIENPLKIASKNYDDILKLSHGALATSGNSYRFILKDNIRYGHIINPKTGWPDIEAPLSITVAAASCTDAGILSTLAMLHGKDAEVFLDLQGVKYWCYR